MSSKHTDELTSPQFENVISLEHFKRVKETFYEDREYDALIQTMTKLELLDEMIRFQEKRTEMGTLDLKMMIRGRHLFDALEKNAETREMRLLARSYKRHLEHELLQHKRAE